MTMNATNTAGAKLAAEADAKGTAVGMLNNTIENVTQQMVKMFCVRNVSVPEQQLKILACMTYDGKSKFSKRKRRIFNHLPFSENAAQDWEHVRRSEADGGDCRENGADQLGTGAWSI